jgi:hypothetical protein
VRRNKLTKSQKEEAVESVRNTGGGTKVGKGIPLVSGLLQSSREGVANPKEGARRLWTAAGKTGWNSKEDISSGEEELALGRERGTA